MFKKILPFVVACFVAHSVFAQNETGPALMPGLLQNAKINPAQLPAERFVIGVPGVFGSYSHNVGGVGDILREEDDSTIAIRSDVLLKNLDEENTLRLHLELETFRAAFRLNENLAFSLHHAARSVNYLRYPETLPKLFLQGNSQYIGQDVAFGPDQHTFAYNEIGLGAAFTFGKLSIGVNGKALLGIGDVSVTNSDLTLYTDPDIYQLTLSTDYQINTATFDEVLFFDSLSGFGEEYGWDEIFQFENFQTGNTGFAFDVGLTYQISDRLQVGASVLDIGKINWRKDVINYNSKGESTFEGLDLKGALTGDSVSISSAIDTVENIFSFEKTEESYSTDLPARYYLNANYKVSDKLTVAATYNGESYRDQLFHAYGIGGSYALNKNLSFGASYNVRNDSYFNIGLSLITRLGPVQFYAMTDNIAVAFQPYDSNNVNARVGLNFVFGKDKEE
ncbi:MAG: DUF5723 family protein [Saprospiraceae bacterium]